MTTALILAAGKGTRLLPLSARYPKPLFPVGDRPCLLYLIELLRERGVRDFVVNLHHLGELIQAYLGDGESFGATIRYSPEEKLLGTGGGIRRAFSLLEQDDGLLVVNGDNLLDFDPTRLIRFQAAKGSIATLALRPRSNDSPYTPVFLGRKSLVHRIGGESDERSYFFPGVQFLSPAFIQLLSGRNPLSLIEHGYLRALKKNLPVAGMPVSGYWREIGTIRQYWEANLDFLKGRSPAYFYRGRENFTRRGIYAGKRCQLGQRVSFYYPVYLGEDCSVGAGSVLGPHVLVGSGSRIGENCRLENVLLWPESKIRKNSSISNAIITPFGRVDLEMT